MDPITGGLAVIGLGMQLFGGISGSQDAARAHAVQQQIAGQESILNDQKRQAMELNNRRSQLENVRNTQRARAMGLNAAVNQGAQFGSGIAGGQAQAQDQGNYNALGMNQSLQFGRTAFDINGRITGLKSELSSVQTDQATDQGIMSMGGSILGSSKTLGNISQGFGNFQLFGGGSPSGYGK